MVIGKKNVKVQPGISVAIFLKPGAVASFQAITSQYQRDITTLLDFRSGYAYPPGLKALFHIIFEFYS